MSPIPPPAPHGGDGRAVAAALGLHPEEILDLSLSLNPVAPDPVPLVAAAAASVRHYPDPARAHLALAETMDVPPGRLLLTNGGAEAIALVAAEIGGRVTEPEFSLHPRRGTEDAPVWRSNPHNPSGLLAGPEEQAGVWDEAFYPLATGCWTRGDPGCIVVGSLTKLLACPGLRVGYVVADDALVARLAKRQPAWSVNGLVAAVLPSLLARVDLPRWSTSVRELRAQLVDLLRAHGLAPRPSDANWVLVEAPDLRSRLAPAGVVVRDCSSFAMPGVHRVAVPSESGLAFLESALSRAGTLGEPRRGSLAAADRATADPRSARVEGSV